MSGLDQHSELTLRHFFAGCALDALIRLDPDFHTYTAVTKQAYRFADAMLAESNRRPPPPREQPL